MDGTVLYCLPAVTTLDPERSYEPFAVLRSLLTALTIEERLLGSQYLARGSAAPVHQGAPR
jgi:hypothetical protein